MNRLIGLYSSAPQSGKSSIASHLATLGFHTVSFASPLKTMVRAFLSEAGIPASYVDELLTTRKEELIPEFGVSSRHLMQTLGTEWGRQCVCPDVWVQCWRRRVQRLMTSGFDVVCDDVRFPNEALTLRALGGELWRVRRPGTARGTTHASEGSLDDLVFDRQLDNSGRLTDLHVAVRQALTVSTPVAS